MREVFLEEVLHQYLHKAQPDLNSLSSTFWEESNIYAKIGGKFLIFNPSYTIRINEILPHSR